VNLFALKVLVSVVWSFQHILMFCACQLKLFVLFMKSVQRQYLS